MTWKMKEIKWVMLGTERNEIETQLWHVRTVWRSTHNEGVREAERNFDSEMGCASCLRAELKGWNFLAIFTPLLIIFLNNKEMHMKGLSLSRKNYSFQFHLEYQVINLRDGDWEALLSPVPIEGQQVLSWPHSCLAPMIGNIHFVEFI